MKDLYAPSLLQRAVLCVDSICYSLPRKSIYANVRERSLASNMIDYILIHHVFGEDAVEKKYKHHTFFMNNTNL